MKEALLKLILKNICIIISILLIACAGYWVYRGRFVAIMLTFSTEKELFDVDIKIPPRYKEVSPGEEVLVQLTLYNIKRIGQVEVGVEYGIEDTEGNEIVSEDTTLAVEFQVSVVRDLDVPFDTKPGDYVLFARARYDDVVGTGSSLFRVVEKEELGMGETTVFYLIVIIFVLLTTIIVLGLYKRVMRTYIKSVKRFRGFDRLSRIY